MGDPMSGTALESVTVVRNGTQVLRDVTLRAASGKLMPCDRRYHGRHSEPASIRFVELSGLSVRLGDEGHGEGQRPLAPAGLG